MGGKTGISWCDSTWNPIRGCSRESQGCMGCYAERTAARFSAPGQPFHGYVDPTRSGSLWTGKVDLVPEMLPLPLRWKRPRKIFVNSMSDLFHPNLPFGKVMRVWDVMCRADQHTMLVLTKRGDRLAQFLRLWADAPFEGAFIGARGPAATREAHPEGRGQLFADMLDTMGEPPPGCAFPTYDWQGGMKFWPPAPFNIWPGFSAEHQDAFDARWAELRDVIDPAQNLMVSAEPLLGPLVLPKDFLALRHRAWVIVGGESGPKARPMRLQWAADLVEQCRRAKVAVWMKQAGSNRQEDWPSSITAKKGDDLAELPSELRHQEFPLRMMG